MDSVVPGEGGYTTESTLGYVWTGPALETGLAPVFRLYDNQTGNPAAGDHATAVEVAPLPQWENLAYYAPEGAEGYAYARFPGTDSVLAGIAAGGVTFNVNLAVGCAGWEWWWNDIEFVNDYDYGRQIQIAMYPADGSSALGEAGDEYGGPAIAVAEQHPSPCVQYSNALSSVSPSLTTAAVPLEWNPSQFGGGPNNPVIYPSVLLGKTVTLNWVGPDGVNRDWPVALRCAALHWMSSSSR